MVAESCCIPIPSEIVVPYGGFLARAPGSAGLWAVIVVACRRQLGRFDHCLRIGPAVGTRSSCATGATLVFGRITLTSPELVQPHAAR